MNDDLQSYIKPELEARIVALVLGEASAFESEEMERLMDESPELRRYKEGVEKVHGLVGEAHRERNEEGWTLSKERRSAVFFKIEERKRKKEKRIEKQREKRISRQGLVYLCAACLVLALILLVTIQLSMKQFARDSATKAEASFMAQESGGDELARLDESIIGQRDLIRNLTNTPNFSNRESGQVPEPTPVAPKRSAANALAAIDAQITSDGKDSHDEIVGGVITAGMRGRLREDSTPDSGSRFEVEGKDTYAFSLTSGNEGGDIGRPDGLRGSGLKDRALTTTWAAKADGDEDGLVTRTQTRTSGRVPTPGDITATGAFFKSPSVDSNENGDSFGFAEKFSPSKRGGDKGMVVPSEPAAATSRLASLNKQVADKMSLKEERLSAEALREEDRSIVKEAAKMNLRGAAAAEDHFGTGGVAANGTGIAGGGGGNLENQKEMPQNYSVRPATTPSLSKPAASPKAFTALKEELKKSKENVSEDQLLQKKQRTRYERKPAAPSSFNSKAIAANTTTPAAIPVPEIDVTSITLDFGDGKDFGGTLASLFSEQSGKIPKDKALGDKFLNGAADGEGKRTMDSLDIEDRFGAVLGRLDRPGQERVSRELRTNVEKNDPGSGVAKKGLGYLGNSSRSNSSQTKEKGRSTDTTRRSLATVEKFHEDGFFDKEEEELNEAAIDSQDSKTARDWSERATAVPGNFYRSSFEEARPGKLKDANQSRELEQTSGGGGGGRRLQEGEPDPFEAGAGQVMEDAELSPMDNGGQKMVEEDSSDLKPFDFGDVESIPYYATAELGGDENGQSKVTSGKMKQIILPEFKLENTTVEDALAMIEEKARELDSTSLDPIDAGLKFNLRLPRTVNEENGGSLEGFGAPIDHSKTKIKNLDLKNVPLAVAVQYLADEANLRYKIESDGAVTLLPITSEEDEDVTQRRWDVEPGLLAWLKPRGNESESFETTLKRNGVSFPQGARASLLADENTVIVRNTPTNLELIDGMFWAFKKDVKAKEAARKALRERESFETSTAEKSDSTFSLNVSDVSFKLAKSALAGGNWPDASKVRSEEFINALDYDDTKPSQREKVSCAIEQGAHPFMQQRNLMRIAMSTASLGRNAATPLRLTILLDQSGSMERADRTESVKRAFALLAAQLNANDEVTLVGFARTPRLLAERVKGNEAMKLAEIIAKPLTEGGTNLEEALSSGLQLARQQFVEGAQNRIILLTDGAVNLGDALPENLAKQVEMMRKHKIAFDACGVGADGLNDEVLSSLAKQGDGRYYFLDRPEDADDGFAKRIAGALRPAAKNVKVQILFNPERVSKFKLYGFEKHKLKKEDFRNDSVDAAEMAAEESGVALYHFEPIPDGRGDVGTVSVRFLDTESNEMVERTWAIPYQPESPLFSEADPALRLAGVAGLFAEKLKGSPVGERVDLKRLRQETELLKPDFDLQPRFREFKTMLQQAGQ